MQIILQRSFFRQSTPGVRVRIHPINGSLPHFAVGKLLPVEQMKFAQPNRTKPIGPRGRIAATNRYHQDSPLTLPSEEIRKARHVLAKLSREPHEKLTVVRPLDDD